MNRAQHDARRRQEAFDEAHKAGAEQFGPLWLRVNDWAVTKALGLFDTASLDVRDGVCG